jgi:serine/threonine-protein kinase HipA
MADKYIPQDHLFLWWLGDPAQPRPVGELGQAAGGRAVSLRYSPDWLRSGFALSEDLPLTSELFVPREKDCAAGAVDDARPDRWGERVIRRFEPSPRLSILEFLLFEGDERYGALGVSQRADAYAPWRSGPMPSLDSLQEMAEVVRKVLANEAVPERQLRLVRPGASLGGARHHPRSRFESCRLEGRIHGERGGGNRHRPAGAVPRRWQAAPSAGRCDGVIPCPFQSDLPPASFPRRRG